MESRSAKGAAASEVEGPAFWSHFRMVHNSASTFDGGDLMSSTRFFGTGDA